MRPYIRATPSLRGAQLHPLAKVNIYHHFFTIPCLLFEGQQGEFAKQKVLKVLDDYKKKKLDANEANELVELIGEPLLKDRLSEVMKEEMQ